MSANKNKGLKRKSSSRSLSDLEKQNQVTDQSLVQNDQCLVQSLKKHVKFSLDITVCENQNIDKQLCEPYTCNLQNCGQFVNYEFDKFSYHANTKNVCKKCYNNLLSDLMAISDKKIIL